MRARLTAVAKSYGAQVVLANASLEVGPDARIGLVGPNGIGKSTVLRLLAAEEVPDAGVIALDPPRATVAHLRQEPGRLPDETLRARLARLTGVAAAERELEQGADPETAAAYTQAGPLWQSYAGLVRYWSKKAEAAAAGEAATL